MILYTQPIVSCSKVVWPFKIVFHYNLPMPWTFVVEDVTGVTNIDYDEHKKIWTAMVSRRYGQNRTFTSRFPSLYILFRVDSW